MGECLFLRKGEVHTAPVKPLENYTWAEIRAISDTGTAANYFCVGDTKSIVINGTVGSATFSNLLIDVFILGFDHNSSREGANRIHFSIGKINGVDMALCDSGYFSSYGTSPFASFVMNTTNTNSGGWNSSYMRKTVLGSNSTPTSPTANTLLAALPSDLRAIMKSVTKYTDNTGGGSNTASYVTATTDYLWLLAEFEVYGARTYANSAEQNSQAQYQYYKAGNSAVRRRHNVVGNEAYWTLRSTETTSRTAFCMVSTDGSGTTINAYSSLSVSPAFAV